MKKIFTIKCSAVHGAAGKKYKEILQGGAPIAAPVELRKKAAKLEAVVDGADKIGYAEIDPAELPNVYEVKITGLNENGDFEAVLIADENVKVSGDDFEAEKEEIVKKGMVSKTKLQTIIDHLKKSRVANDIIAMVLVVISQATEDQAELGEKEARYEDANPSRLYSILHDVLICVFIKACCIFEGPKSTGKNVLAKTIAWLLCLPFYQMTLNLDTTSDDAFGPRGTDNSASERLDLELALAKLKVTLKPEEANEELLKKAAEFDLFAAKSASTQIKRLSSDLVKWALYGGVFLFDEINMAEANFLQSIIHPLADGTKCLIGPGEIGIIPLHPNCVLLAGMNPPTAAYAGTKDLNDATASRCAHIRFEMPESISELLKANFDMEHTTLKEKHFKACDEVYKEFKHAVDSGSVTDKCLNVRGFVRALEAVEMFPQSTKLSWQITEVQILSAIQNDSERTMLEAMVRDKVAI